MNYSVPSTERFFSSYERLNKGKPSILHVVKETGESKSNGNVKSASENFGENENASDYSNDGAVACSDKESNAVSNNYPNTTMLRYSTTSSVYANYFLADPDYGVIIYCIAAIIQAQIFDDLSQSMNFPIKDKDFDMITSLPPECGGPVKVLNQNILDQETVNDAELRQKLIEGVVPTIDTIYKFMCFVHKHLSLAAACDIISLIYLNRITSAVKEDLPAMQLSIRNWRGVWIASVMLAQKVWQDNPYKTSYFTTFLPSVGIEQLKFIEMKALTFMDFRTGVTPSLYAKYYFELRDLFFNFTGLDSSHQNCWRSKPLTLIESERLKDRSLRYSVKVKGKKFTKLSSHSNPTAAATGTATGTGGRDPSMKMSQDPSVLKFNAVSGTSYQPPVAMQQSYHISIPIIPTNSSSFGMLIDHNKPSKSISTSESSKWTAMRLRSIRNQMETENVIVGGHTKSMFIIS